MKLASQETNGNTANILKINVAVTFSFVHCSQININLNLKLWMAPLHTFLTLINISVA